MKEKRELEITLFGKDAKVNALDKINEANVTKKKGAYNERRYVHYAM